MIKSKRIVFERNNKLSLFNALIALNEKKQKIANLK